MPGFRSTARVTTVSVYTRSLDDITARLPEVVDATLALPVTTLIADAEAIALRPDGRPHRFQVTASRFGAHAPTSRAPAPRNRCRCSSSICCISTAPTCWTCRPRSVSPHSTRSFPPRSASTGWPPSDGEAAAAFLAATLAAGHEGVMAKSPTAPYEAGRRGAGWLKVKPVHTLDLVVLAVEWGSGRRTGKLSNIHLGARDPQNGGFVMLGKTFKGMTDEMLDWQTERFLELAVDGTDGLRGDGPARAGGRDRPRRRADLHPLPRRDGVALRPRAALPRRQGPCRGRHRRHGAHPVRKLNERPRFRQPRTARGDRIDAWPLPPRRSRSEETVGDVTYVRTDANLPPVAIIDRSPITTKTQDRVRRHRPDRGDRVGGDRVLPR